MATAMGTAVDDGASSSYGGGSQSSASRSADASLIADGCLYTTLKTMFTVRDPSGLGDGGTLNVAEVLLRISDRLQALHDRLDHLVRP
jgi:hypothetical protein